MKKLLLCIAASGCISYLANGQCTTTNATSCICPPGGGTDCDLLPDIKVSVDALQNGYTVYSQTGNIASGSQGSNDGRLRLTGTTPNIGYGPLETRSINKWLCGTDTLFSNPGSLCPDGRVPKRFVTQRIYHKNGNAMSFTDVPCGTMTYHASHGHMHIDNWGIYTLRIQDPNIPDPTRWSIVGTGTKLAFCLLDIGACNNSNGIFCRDDNNNPQITNQIPNYTIGNGSYGCSSTLQGISNGWYDTYSSSLDGMWIDIPPGTCNGTYYIVVQLDPNSNMTELNESNNVIAVPVTITNQSTPGSPSVTISADKPGTILPGQFVNLTATAGSSYNWSTGATTQSISVNASGSYTCTVTNYCGTATSAPFVVSVLPPAPDPVTTGASICSGSTATLTATNGGNGILKWYNSPGSAIPLATGNSYTTPTLFSTTDYFVENSVTTLGTVSHVGPVNNSIGSGAYQTTAPSNAWYLQFDAVCDLVLQTVKVYASTAGNRTFILQDRGSAQLKSMTVAIPAAGANTINLNWFIPAGDGYKLLVSGTPNLYYNTSGVAYPYLVSGVCRITGSYSGHSNYPFFYDMTVKSPDLVSTSNRVASTATVTSTVTVSINASLGTICNGQSSTLTASGATSYLWSTSETTSSIVVSPSTTTNYSVTGTTAGCSGMNSISVTVNPVPVVSVNPSNPSICEGSATALTASGAAAYLWSTGQTTANIVVAPSSTTAYSVIGTTAGCNGGAGTTVTVNAVPLISINASATSICGGSSASLTASGATSYLWSTGATTSSIVVSPSSTTTYSVTGTASGCTGQNSVQVSVQASPVVTITPSASAICDGGSATLDANGADFYLWSTGQTTANITVSPASTTSYSVVGTTAGCTGNASQSIAVGTTPVVTINPPLASICSGTSATLTASGADSYLWSTSETTTSITVSPASTTSYNVSGSSAGCTGNSSADVTVQASPTVVITPSASSICEGESMLLEASGADAYNWSTSETTANISVSPASTTSYSVSGITAGCQGSASQTVVVNPLPSVTVSVTDISCYGLNDGVAAANVSGGTPGYSYSWNTLPVQTSPSVSGLSPGNYTVTVTDANGCGDTQTQQVGEPDALMVSGVPSDETCSASNGAVNLSASGGTAPLSYSWSPGGATTEDLTNVSAGSYTVVVTDAHGCTQWASYSIGTSGTAPAQPAPVAGNTYICRNSSNNIYSVDFDATAATYFWTLPSGAAIASGQGTNSITVNFASNQGSGNICVSAGNLCGNSPSRCKPLSVVTTKPGVPITIAGPDVFCGAGSGIVYECPAVANAESYNWTVPSGVVITDGDGTRSITVDFPSSFSSGTFRVSASNCAGTSNNRSLSVSGKPSTPASISGPLGVCSHQSGVIYSVAPVTGATSYSWSVPQSATLVSGQGTTSIVVNFGNSAGKISVRAINSCGQSTAKTITVSVVCRFADVPSAMQVFPNPTHDHLNITFYSSNESGYSIVVTDLAGRIVSSSEGTVIHGRNETGLDMSDVAKGVYLLQLLVDGEKMIQKVVVD